MVVPEALPMSLHLSDGDRVCVIGGGPAGSFAALHLLHLARQRGWKRLEVLIFEPRHFERPGPGGCNRCAGILSYRLLSGMETLSLTLPDEIVQADLHAYTIHLHGSKLRIEQPDPTRRIVTVYRGGGPCKRRELTPRISFDNFLLHQACERGAVHVQERVKKVTVEGDTVVIHTRTRTVEADFMVLATGVNSRPPLASEFGYHAPKTAVMVQDEFRLPPDWNGDQVSAFFGDMPGLLFGALIPKGRYLTVSLLGEGLRLDSVNEFADAHGLSHALLPPSGGLCGCTPRIAVGPAHHYYGSRWVAVGDAAVTRLYKDGIGSAFNTSRVAMQTAVERGISRQAFSKGYAPYCRKIHTDNRYGRLLFKLWQFSRRSSTLISAWKNAIDLERSLPSEKQVHSRILWGMLTGDEPYKKLFWLSLTPPALMNLARGWLG